MRCAPWREDATALRAERGGDSTPGRRGMFGMQLAGGGVAVLIQCAQTGNILAPLAPFGRATRRTPVTWQPVHDAGDTAAWCVEHHGNGVYTLQVAADAAPRRVLTLDDGDRLQPRGLVASRDPRDAFPAAHSLFTLEAVVAPQGGLQGWCLRSARSGRLVLLACDDMGDAIMAPPAENAASHSAVRIVDVASAAAAPEVLRMDASGPSHAKYVTAALRALQDGTAVPLREVASLRSLAVATLGRMHGSAGPDALPECALDESTQVALFGDAFVPDDMAQDVARAWKTTHPDAKDMQPCKAGAAQPLFPGAMTCTACSGQVFRMAPATHPGHHQFLESVAGRLRGRANRGPDSPGGRFWTAIGSTAVYTMVAIAAANGLRIALRQQRRAADAPLQQMQPQEVGH